MTTTTTTTTTSTTTTSTTTTTTTANPLNAARSFSSSTSYSTAGGNSFSNLYGYANDGTYNYLLDNTVNTVFKFGNSWVYVSKTTLPFSSPFYLTYVSGNWFITGNNGIYKTDSTFTTIVASATTGTHYGLYYDSTSSTIYAVKSGSVMEYTTGLAVSYTNTISGYIFWSITASGNTFYIGTTDGLVLAMTSRAVTGNFNGCNSRSSNTVYSIMVQGTTVMTECFGDTYFYTGSGSSFIYQSGITSSTSTGKGVWLDLKNCLVVTDVGSYIIKS